jgi:hypothetical protein
MIVGKTLQSQRFERRDASNREMLKQLGNNRRTAASAVFAGIAALASLRVTDIAHDRFDNRGRRSHVADIELIQRICRITLLPCLVPIL